MLRWVGGFFQQSEGVLVDEVVMSEREDADMAVVPKKVRLSVSRVTVPPLPLLGEIRIFPVVFPPIVKVLFRTLWIEPSPLRYIPLVESAPEVAETEAIGVCVPLTPMTANLAEG